MQWMKICPETQNPELDIAMGGTAGDCTPHRGQDKDSQPDLVQPTNLEAPDPGQQEGQQQEEPANLKKMQGDVPPEIIKRLECNSISSKELVSA